MGMVRAIVRFGLAAGFAAVPAGCASDKPQPVSPQDFYAQPAAPAMVASPTTMADNPGILPSPDAKTSAPPRNSFAEVVQSDLASRPRSTTMPDLALMAPSTRPSTLPAIAGDQYLTLGGVVMVVNGRPIYADKVLRMDANILRQTARQMSMTDFEEAARNQIERTIGELRDNELEIAAAERTLDPKDIQLAKVPDRAMEQAPDRRSGGVGATRPRSGAGIRRGIPGPGAGPVPPLPSGPLLLSQDHSADRHQPRRRAAILPRPYR